MTPEEKLQKSPVLIDIPMPIQTPRLLLRPPQPGDGMLITAAKKESWAVLTQWMIWAQGEPDPVSDEIVAREALAKFILRTDLMMLGIEKDSGMPVVFTGLHRIDWHARIFEIGYWVRKTAQGRGIATEAAHALTRYAFQELAARKVIIAHAAGNDPSAAVIRKLGFEREAIERYGTTLPDGRVVDQYRYARFNTDELPDLDIRW